MEQLAGLDATFLYCETPTMHLHVCGLLLLDPSTMPSGYSYDRVRSMLSERLLKLPSVRQKLATAPLNLGRLFWVDDPNLDLDHHVHRVVLEPGAGDERSLAKVVGDIAGGPLRRDRPLWELWVIEGLADGRVAILVKMHHSTIDGVSGASLMGRELPQLSAVSTSTSTPTNAIHGTRTLRLRRREFPPLTCRICRISTSREGCQGRGS